jgi:NADPH-dependent 7-cyano-7-deazaguanine reductase QueF
MSPEYDRLYNVSLDRHVQSIIKEGAIKGKTLYSYFKRLQQFRILHEHCILETFNLQKNGIKDL